MDSSKREGVEANINGGEEEGGGGEVVDGREDVVDDGVDVIVVVLGRRVGKEEIESSLPE